MGLVTLVYKRQHFLFALDIRSEVMIVIIALVNKQVLLSPLCSASLLGDVLFSALSVCMSVCVFVCFTAGTEKCLFLSLDRIWRFLER